jgi:hypothetical protein
MENAEIDQQMHWVVYFIIYTKAATCFGKEMPSSGSDLWQEASHGTYVPWLASYHIDVEVAQKEPSRSLMMPLPCRNM